MSEIEDLLDILARPARVSTIIGEELTALKQEFALTKLGARRSVIEHNAQDLATEDLITPTDMVVTLSHSGYIKSQPLNEYRAQKRGGRGKQATADQGRRLDRPALHRQHARLPAGLLQPRPPVLAEGVGSAGRLARLARQADRQHVPAAGRREDQRGAAAHRRVPQLPRRPLRVHGDLHGHGEEDRARRVQQPAQGGIIAVDLDAGDYLIGAALTDGKHDVMLFSDGGKAVRFDENDVRPMGRNARGVRGMMLDEGQSVIAMLVAEDESQSVLTATENGYGKRTPIAEYTRHGRGTKGMIAIQQSERNGKVVAATLVHADDEIMLITDRGVLVRTRVSEIRELGRATQGVTLIGLDEGSKLSGLQRIVENDAGRREAEGAERRRRHAHDRRRPA
jgi:DNA gyrase subunit A